MKKNQASNFVKYLLAVILATLLLVFVGCGDDPDTEGEEWDDMVSDTEETESVTESEAEITFPKDEF